MKILSIKQIREADAYTISHEPIASIDLMERAANACTTWMCNMFEQGQELVFFVGPGNNGGDGWAMARQLADKGYRNIKLYLLGKAEKISEDSQVNRHRLQIQKLVTITEMTDEKDFPVISHGAIILDALFGSGLSRPLDGMAGKLVKFLNILTNTKISIDMPSGLFGDDNSKNIPENIINANYTLTFQVPKRSFFFIENSHYTGEWHILPIGLHLNYLNIADGTDFYIEKEDIIRRWRPRNKFSHKGNFGHGLLIAGSYGMMGAAILGAKASIRCGIGLITTHIPLKGYDIMQSAVPEAIVNMDSSETVFSKVPNLELYTAVAVGPGLGRADETQKAMQSLLRLARIPLVIDADGLNILSENPSWLTMLPEGTILTPHPKEFDRLFGKANTGFDRWKRQKEVAQKYKIVIVLKGAYTSITTPDGESYFNSTGNPGMATGGMGDVLTGIILSLVAMGYNSIDAAIIGVFIHGLAGDIAVQYVSKPALMAGDIMDYLGKSFLHLKLD